MALPLLSGHRCHAPAFPFLLRYLARSLSSRVVHSLLPASYREDCRVSDDPTRKKREMTTILSELFLIGALAAVALAQCPSTITAPCSCATTRYEPISVVCDQAGSLAAVLQAIGSPQSTIDSLVISNTPIDQIPAFAFRTLSIKRLVFRNNDLLTIHPQAFDGPLINTLNELEIRSNMIGEIPQSGIPALRNLRSLVLSNNGIVRVTNNAFLTYQCRTILRRLDLSANQLTDIPAQGFLGLESIEQISLDKNYLSQVPTAALSHLVTLEDLSLGVNHLDSIGVGAFPLPNLKSLSLEVNRLTSMPAEALQQVPNLLYLYLSNNQFSTVDPLMFYYVNQLKVLAMGNNEHIRQLNVSTFQFIPGLVRLEMPDCALTDLQPGVFQKIPKVQVIVLNNNKLTSIARGAFNTLSELVSLDLKGNEISVVEDRSFSGLSSLKQLDLSSNRIQLLARDTFSGSFEQTVPPTSRVLYLYENPWTCDERLDWFRQWLRDNRDIQITAPGYEPTKCWKPAFVNGLELRQTDPVTTQSPIAKSAVAKAPANVQTVQSTLTKEVNRKPINLITSQSTELGAAIVGPNIKPENKLAGINLAAVILGIIMGIFFVSLVLLMAVRYMVGKSRRQRKQDEDLRRFGGSTVSAGYNSGYGSAYPSPPEPGSHMYHNRAAQQRTGYFLNRPWYWWF
uniref:Uncharacterized protein n=1 Tax=Plectus sambesii TaxID=2011161 RepID=A0A914WNM2_9BILA